MLELWLTGGGRPELLICQLNFALELQKFWHKSSKSFLALIRATKQRKSDHSHFKCPQKLFSGPKIVNPTLSTFMVKLE